MAPHFQTTSTRFVSEAQLLQAYERVLWVLADVASSRATASPLTFCCRSPKQGSVPFAESHAAVRRIEIVAMARHRIGHRRIPGAWGVDSKETDVPGPNALYVSHGEGEAGAYYAAIRS